MTNEEDALDDDDLTYHVVVNDEEQYSIWAADRDLPAGWRAEGTTGPKQECLDHIDEIWTDMRPLSLRKWMEEQARREQEEPPEAAGAPEEEIEPLPVRLSRADTRVALVLYPEASPAALREAIDHGFVILRFEETDGGTDLGVDLDTSDVGEADLDAGTGTVRLSGTLTLDYTPVRCHAVIDVAAMSGQGRLEILEPA
jgi:uncharacterized protein YbdZ (MbtH family)